MPLLWPGAQESCLPQAMVHQAMLGMPSTLYNTASRSAEVIERTHRHRLGRPCTRGAQHVDVRKKKRARGTHKVFSRARGGLTAYIFAWSGLGLVKNAYTMLGGRMKRRTFLHTKEGLAAKINFG